ncbi:MAG: hypothetical protein H0W85_04260 [Methylotenera sp.]|nr:hypothetical protein [Methylotenera sp.]
MAKSVLDKLVLCATAHSLLAGIWHAGKLQGSQVFANDGEGHLAFKELLKRYSAAPVYLIADAVEEDYRLESLPHTGGSAKREMIERKLNQFYRGLEYRTAHFINRETDKRRDDKYLFAALNNVDFLQPWVTSIQAVQAQLVGIYLLPMLSQILVRQLKLMAPHILLCERLSSGLRQTYLHNGRLRMSRLVPNSSKDGSQLGYFYLVETEKTRLYLISQRFIASETSLNLILASADGNTQAISQAISQEQSLETTDINLSQFAKSLGLSAQAIQQIPELVHMQLLANGHVVDNLAPPALTKQYQFNTLKQGIKISTTALTVIGICVAAGLSIQALLYKSDLDQAAKDTLIQQHRYDEVAKNFPVTPINAYDLKTAVELESAIDAYPKSPRRLMQVVSTALEKLPQIQLDRLRWAFTNDPNIKDDDKLISVTTGKISTQPIVPTGFDTTKLNEVGFITAEILGFTGDYRGALENVRRFETALKEDSQVSAIEVLQEPVNVSSFVDLQGSTTDEQSTQKQPAIFKLKLVLKAPGANVVK